MKKVISVSIICLLVLFTTGNSSYAQTCSPENGTSIQGFYKLKYCMENLGWRESVKQNEWRVTVYNLYDDVNIRIDFNLVEAGAPAKGLSYKLIKAGKSTAISFYFSSTPEFVYDNIELIKN